MSALLSPVLAVCNHLVSNLYAKTDRGIGKYVTPTFDLLFILIENTLKVNLSTKDW